MTFFSFTIDAERPPLEAFATLGYVAVVLTVAAFVVAIAATLLLTVGQPDGRFSGLREQAAGTAIITGGLGVLGSLLAVALLV
jgi:hypothetical protein